MNTQVHRAPWGKTLRWVSALSAALILAVLASAQRGPSQNWVRLAIILPVLILPGAALFVIRGYTIEPRELLIRRLLWTTRLPLAELQSATVQPDVMRGSFRLCGNGGLFSITGWYRNSALGNYRAFVTDLNRTVVLRFSNRIVVVSPENPGVFAGEISNFKS
jgi:Bacterial PH domain